MDGFLTKGTLGTFTRAANQLIYLLSSVAMSQLSVEVTAHMSTWDAVMANITQRKTGFPQMPLNTFRSSKIERQLNSLKIWQNTKVLKMMV